MKTFAWAFAFAVVVMSAHAKAWRLKRELTKEEKVPALFLALFFLIGMFATSVGP